MGTRPDYVGIWDEHDFSSLSPTLISANIKTGLYNDNLFCLFITQSTRIKGSAKVRFSARSIDALGKAECKGIISKNEIKFEKQYCRAAIRKGAIPSLLTYYGVRTVEDKKTLGKLEQFAGLILTKKPEPLRVFIMKNYDLTSPMILDIARYKK